MPVCRALHKAIISPPKNGTHTTMAVMRKLGGSELNGHIPYGEMKYRVAKLIRHCEFAMPVREPRARFVSAINHQYGERWKNLDAAYEAWLRKPHGLFHSQSFYLEGATDVALFTFESFGHLHWLGWTAPIPHELPGRAKWSAAEIFRHPIAEAFDRWEEDLDLYYSLKAKEAA